MSKSFSEKKNAIISLLNERLIFEKDYWGFFSDNYIHNLLKKYKNDEIKLINNLDDLKLNIIKMNIIPDVDPNFNKSKI